MAIWGDKLLRQFIQEGHIRHYDDSLIGPGSIDLRLGHTFLRHHLDRTIRLGEEIQYRKYYIEDGETITLQPHEFMLATTMEYVDVPIFAGAFVQGRSSIGRAGLTVQNAGYVDPGFHGHITLELKNDAPCRITLHPGYPVAQLVYMDATGVSEGYKGKYNEQIEATGSRMQMDDERFKR